MWYMKQVNLRLTELTVAAIDELRGIAPRNAWIAQAVDEKIARATDPQMVAVPHVVRVPEPPPSKSPPAKTVKVAQPPPRTDDVTPDTPATVEAKMQRARQIIDTAAEHLGCTHPKAKQRTINGGAVVCDACNRRVR